MRPEHCTILADTAGFLTTPVQSRLLALQWLSDLANPQKQPNSPEPRPKDAEDGGGEAAAAVAQQDVDLRSEAMQALLRGARDAERCVRVACADHLLALVGSGGLLSKETKGRLVAAASERLSDLDTQVARKWMRMLCLLAREGCCKTKVSLSCVF